MVFPGRLGDLLITYGCEKEKKKVFKTYAYCFYDLDLEGDESMSMAVCLLIQCY